MKRILTLILTSIAAINNSFASTISQQTAQHVAINFFNTNVSKVRGTVTATPIYTEKENDNTVDFYVFSISPKGFVIVSADDNVSPVIAYSSESNFNTNFEKTGIKDWVNHAAKNIHTAVLNHSKADARISGLWSAYKNGQNVGSAKSTVVAPLIATTWNQDTFYNQFCPYSNQGQQLCVTGCVATSMAQIMKFWNFPAQGNGSYSYNNCTPNFTYNYGIQSANFAATNYNWDSMPNSLTGPNAQVATLMYQCAVGVAMNFGDENQGGSSAYVLQSDVPSWKHSAEYAYKNYFSYNPNTMQDLHSADYSSAQWLSMIEGELQFGRPILYIGLDTLYGGHAWVCDGYDQNDMLHMNWGWGGQGDGYYSISNLSVDGFNFSNEEGALIGIIPNINIPQVTATVSKNGICSGDVVSITVQGPSTASYSWTPVTGLDCPTCAVTTARPLTSTTYTVTMDSAGFSSTTSVTIKVNAALVISSSISDVTCFGGNNGSAMISASGGSPDYLYVWNNGQSSSQATNLSAGEYSVTVNDAAGCSASAIENISQPEALNVTITVSNNSATANVTGGDKDYFYLWSNDENTETLSNLSAGDYSVTVNDSHKCMATTAVVINGSAPVASQDNTVPSATTTKDNMQNSPLAFEAYPNPAINVINIKLNELNTEVSMTVKNMLGENMVNKTISSLDTRMDISSLPAGIYFIALTTNGHSFVHQFTINR